MKLMPLYCCLCIASICSTSIAAPQYAMASKGLFGQVELGYLMTSYADGINRYANSSGNQGASDSNFPLKGSIGYNLNKIYAVELGVSQYKTSATNNAYVGQRSGDLNLTLYDALILFHLKVNDSSSWVATPKFGIAYENGRLDYGQYNTDTPPPWGGEANQQNSKIKRFYTPVAGVEFDHSYNQNMAMSFGYQYLFQANTNYGDPYKTIGHSVHYFSVGVIFKP